MKLTVYTQTGDEVEVFDNLPEAVCNGFKSKATPIFGAGDRIFGYRFNDKVYDITVDKAIRRYHMDELITSIIVSIMSKKYNYYVIEK